MDASAVSASQDSGTSPTVNDANVMDTLIHVIRIREYVMNAETILLVQIVPCMLIFYFF